MASTENGVWGSDAGGSFFEMVEEGLMGFGLFLQAGRWEKEKETFQLGSFLEVGFLISTKHCCFSSAIFSRKEELGFWNWWVFFFFFVALAVMNDGGFYAWYL